MRAASDAARRAGTLGLAPEDWVTRGGRCMVRVMIAEPHIMRGGARPRAAFEPGAAGRAGGPRALLIVVLLAAFAARVASALRVPIIEVDGAYWAGLGGALAGGDPRAGWSAAWPPLYPTCIAFAALVARTLGGTLTPATLEACARAVSAIAGTLMLVPLAVIARRMLPPRGAAIALALAAFHPRLIEYSAAALSEMTYALLLVSGLALLVAGDSARPRLARDAGAGACFGLAFCVRPEGLLLAAALWLGGLVSRAPRSGAARWRPAFALAALVAALPYLLFLHAETGRWSLGEKAGYNFWHAYAAEYDAAFAVPLDLARRVNDSPELTRELRSPAVHALAFALRRPGLVLGRGVRNLGIILASSIPVAVYWPFALLAVIGAFVMPWRGGPVAWVLAVLPLLYAPLSVDRRFFVPVVPLLLIFAAGGVIAGEAALERALRDAARARRIVSVALTALLALGFGYALVRAGRSNDGPEQRAAGEWLRAAWSADRRAAHGGEARAAGAAGARPVVMTLKPWVAFYSGGLILTLPDASPDSLLRCARREGADVLVVDERAVRSSRRQLGPLLDPARAPEGLTLMHREPGPNALLLYAVRGVAHAP